MGTYYATLGLEPNADQAAIAAAYQRMRDQYNPARVEDVDPDLRAVAAQRSAELDQIYHVLSDPQRRRQYDISIGLAPKAAAKPRHTITPRERAYAIGGAILAVVLVAAIWIVTGRGDQEQVRAMGEVNRPAPAIELAALTGGSVSLAALRGNVVVVNFWGTWCEPCRRELPALQAAHEQLGDQGLTIIGVNLTDDEYTRGQTLDDVKTFLAQYGVNYPIALDVEGKVTNDYRVFPLPTSFFIDGEGRIRYIHVGELTLEDVTARFNELRQTVTAQRTE